MNWWSVYIIVLCFPLFLSFILTPLLRDIALKINLTDEPDAQDHKSHAKKTPILGGAAMCVAWTTSILIGLYSPSFLFEHGFDINIIKGIYGVFHVTPRMVAIVGGGVLIGLLGLLDDLFNMSAKVKFAGQLAVTLFAVYYGDIKISLFFLPEYASYIITVFWIIVVINAINFFDNMDGLAIGVSSIAFLFFAIASIIFGHHFVACLTIAGLGVSLGFWFYNHSPATIFMGDCGSHFLGYILAVSGAMTTFYQQNVTESPLSVLIPLFVLAIPLFDLISVIVIRIKINKPIYIGDNNHLSHRFQRMGISRRAAVFLIHILTLIISLSVLPILWGDSFTALVCVMQACLILLLLSIMQYKVMMRDLEK